MEFNSYPADPPRRSWLVYLALVVIVIGALVAIQLWNTSARHTRKTTHGSDPERGLLTGDIYSKYAVANTHLLRNSAQKAIDSYDDALPWPAAYRRIAIVKQAFLHKSGLPDLKKLNSSEATRGLSSTQKRKLDAEVKMWERIYADGTVSRAQADSYASRVRKLNLGPLKQVAVAQVYQLTGHKAKADLVMRDAKTSAISSLIGFGVLILFLFLGGLGGLVLAIIFFINFDKYLRNARRPNIQPSVLLITFLVYIVSFVLLSVVLGALGELGGLTRGGASGSGVDLLLNLVAEFGALGLGLSTLWALTAHTGEDPAEAGFRTWRPIRDIGYGIGGFFGSLPFVAVAMLIAALLSSTVFKHVETPQQPFAPIIAQGGALELFLVFALASIAAPIVEETFFRGALYSAFRSRMNAWPAVVLTSVIFAVIHPLPGGFLPIFTLACALALLRERTGSVLPGMVCHCVYNTTVLILTLLMV